MTPALSDLTKSVESYYNSGGEHSKAAAAFGSTLVDVAKAFPHDDKMTEPLLKVTSNQK